MQKLNQLCTNMCTLGFPLACVVVCLFVCVCLCLFVAVFVLLILYQGAKTLNIIALTSLLVVRTKYKLNMEAVLATYLTHNVQCLFPHLVFRLFQGSSGSKIQEYNCGKSETGPSKFLREI